MSRRSLSPTLPALLALATLAAPALALAMAPPAYQNLRRQVKRTSFSSAKLDVIKLAAGGNTFTCAQVRGLLGALSFSSGKIKALRVLSPRIEDPQNSFTIVNAFTFSSDKKKATKILRSAGSAVRHAPPPPHAHHAPPPPHPHGGYAPPAQPAPPARGPPPAGTYRQRVRVQPGPGARPVVAPARRPLAAPAVRVTQNNSAAWAMQGYGHVQNAWPPKAMKRLVRTLKRTAFSRDKLRALQLAVGSRDEGLTANQVLRILKAFGFSRDMVQAIRIMEPKLLGMPAADVSRILKSYPFSRDRLSVLRALKDTILDLENKFVILDAFTFSSDKKKAARILASVRPRSPLYGAIRGRHVVFVIDCSGSMRASVFQVRGRPVNRLDYVRYELGRALRSLRPGTTFNIVVFAGGVVRWQPRGVPVNGASIQQAEAFMAHQRADGATNIWDALRTALSEPGVDEVQFLTDGTPTAGPVRGHANVLRRFRELLPRRGVRINGAAMLMGRWAGDQKARSAQLVCAMAHETHGTCRVFK